MEMKCPACSAALAPADLDRARALARCSFCGTLVDLAGRADPSGGAFAACERPEVPLPPRFRVARGEPGLSVSWRWFTPAAFFLVFFCVAWDGFLVFWYGMAAKQGAPLVFFLFPLIHVSVGVGISYLAA